MTISKRATLAAIAKLGLVALMTLAAPLAGRSQPTGRVYRIGYLTGGSISSNPQLLEAFRDQLKNGGWIEGQNIVVEYRSAEGRLERLPELAAELAQLRVDVIVAGPTPAALAARNATRTIPIVGVSLTHPVELGIVQSLARPGGNLTGVSYSVGPDIFGKDLDLLRQAIPRIQRVAVLSNPDSPSAAITLANIKSAAQSLGLQLVRVDARGPAEFEAAFAAMATQRADALLVVTDPAYIPQRARLIDLSVRRRMPSIFAQRADAEAGGLMSYGPSFTEMYRRAASYADRILKGAKAADLPIEQPTKFELVINLKTARQLGLTIPPSLLAGADQVID